MADAKHRDAPEAGPKQKELFIAARLLKIHPRAQRTVNRVHLKRIAEGLDLDAIGSVHAVKYPIRGQEGPWVVDGQHRVLALMERGLGDWAVRVIIHADVVTNAAAAALFLRLNHRAVVHTWDKFRNSVEAGDPTAVGVDAIARRHELTIGRRSQDGSIAAIAAVCEAFQIDGGKALDHALALIVGAWGRTASAVDGNLVRGLARFLAKYADAVDDEVLAKKLAKFPGGASGLLGKASAYREAKRISMKSAIAELLTDTYNACRKTRLGSSAVARSQRDGKGQ